MEDGGPPDHGDDAHGPGDVALATRRALGIRPTYDLDRVRGFSDAVFAVAITLAVARFRVPDLSTSATEVDRELLAQWPLYLSYLVGFALLGWLWFGHHRLFQILVRADGRLLWANLGFLFWIVLLPFSTIVLAEAGDLTLAHVLFDLNAALAGAAGALLWFYGTAGHRLVGPGLDPQALRIFRARSLVLPTVFGLAALAALISPVAEALVWATIPLGPVVIRWRLGALPQDEASAEREERDEEPQLAIQAAAAAAAAATTGETAGRRGGRRIAARDRAGLDRLAGFSDDIYAFALTITALAFTLPAPSPVTAAQLGDALVDLFWNEGLAFVTGFLVLGLFWNLHLRTFLLLDRTDSRLLLFNLGHLLAIALLPFATQLLSADYGSVPVMVYGGIATLVGAPLALMVRYATVDHRLVDPTLPEDALALRRRIAWVMPVAFALSIGVAIVSPVAAQVLWYAPFGAIRVIVRRAGRIPSAP